MIKHRGFVVIMQGWNRRHCHVSVAFRASMPMNCRRCVTRRNREKKYNTKNCNKQLSIFASTIVHLDYIMKVHRNIENDDEIYAMSF